jgi:hypothetical protein
MLADRRSLASRWSGEAADVVDVRAGHAERGVVAADGLLVSSI